MELRVHGVGGPAADGVLGCRPDRPAVTSWRSQRGARGRVVHCAGQYDVRAYHWSPLTSGSRGFALWPLLLPFTLVNVAGWMAPPVGQRRRVAVHRLAAVVLGLATTATTAVWAFVGGVTVWRTVGHVPGWLPGGPATELVETAAATAAVALLALVLAATYTARGYERFRPDSWSDEPSSWRGWWGESLGRRLDHTRFYDNRRDHEVRWRVHVVVAGAALAATVAAASRAGADRLDHAMGRALLVASGVQAVALLALAVVALPGGSPHRRLSRRLVGASTATTGVFLLGGLVLSALLTLTGIDQTPVGAVAVLYDVYGWVLLGGLAMAVICVAAALLWPLPVEDGPGRRFVPRMGTRLRARLATAPAQVDLVALGLAGVFAVGAGLAVVARWSAVDEDRWRLTSTPPVEIARASFAVVVAFLFVNLWKSRASPAVLRRVGTVWDVLTLWPRAYHPFAVRPYAERAVPELQEFLEHGRRSGGLVVVAHSQGSVLVYAAVRPFVATGAAGPECALPPFGLVTFGSPLRTLYTGLFPHYVDAHEVDTTRRAVAGGWVNCFRFTDHVGRAVFADDEVVAGATGDGADLPIVDGTGAGGSVKGHGGYWDEPVVREAARAAAERLGASDV